MKSEMKVKRIKAFSSQLENYIFETEKYDSFEQL